MAKQECMTELNESLDQESETMSTTSAAAAETVGFARTTEVPVDMLIHALAGVCQTLDQEQISANLEQDEVERIAGLAAAANALATELRDRMSGYAPWMQSRLQRGVEASTAVIE